MTFLKEARKFVLSFSRRVVACNADSKSFASSVIFNVRPYGAAGGYLLLPGHYN